MTAGEGDSLGDEQGVVSSDAEFDTLLGTLSRLDANLNTGLNTAPYSQPDVDQGNITEAKTNSNLFASASFRPDFNLDDPLPKPNRHPKECTRCCPLPRSKLTRERGVVIGELRMEVIFTLIGVSNINTAKMHVETRTVGNMNPLSIEAAEAKPTVSLNSLESEKTRVLVNQMKVVWNGER